MTKTERCEVAIVGAGPVGLWLASSLLQQGIDVRVVESDSSQRRGSRAIGIHPPGLACLDAIGVARGLAERGVAVQRGRAYAGGRLLGSVSFEALDQTFPFVLAVPQAETEAALEDRTLALSPRALVRGHTCSRIESQFFAHAPEAVLRPGGWRLWLDGPTGARALDAAFVVGCDGKRSVVRRALGTAFAGGTYADRFLMADVPDDTDFGADAAVFLTPDGLVESFPLPGGVRRWVVGTGAQRVAPDAELLGQLVLARTGHRLRWRHASLPATFTAERYLAGTFAQDRLALAGDAAHVLSPIGGQGMNLGWLDARALAPALVDCLRGRADPAPALARYAAQRRRAARKAIRRSELFLGIGRRSSWPRLRDAFVRGLLRPELGGFSARTFSMHGL